MTRGVAAVLVTSCLFASNVARASHCQSQIVIFSGRSDLPAQASFNRAACTADPDEATPADGRLIMPLADRVMVTYGHDFGPSTPILHGHLRGLGNDAGITLLRVRDPLGGWHYVTHTMPLDPTAVGCLTATAMEPDSEESLDSNTYHTMGTQCR